MGSLWFERGFPGPLEDDLPSEADLVVAGGGIAGVSTALHASRMGIRVVLLEARHLASRASGRNDGQVLLGLGEHLNRILGQWGEEEGLLLWSFLRENLSELSHCIARDRIPCDFRREGGLRLAASPSEWAELQESSAIMVREGIPHRLLEPGEVAEALPLARGFGGGLFLEEEGVLDPVALVYGLASRAREAGARILEGSPLASVQGQLGDFILLLEDGRRIPAKVLVHATSCHSPGLDPSGFLSRVLFPFRGQILATNPLPPELLEAMPHWAVSANFCFEYFRRTGRRMTLGGLRWTVKGEETGVLDDAGIHPGISRNLRAYLAEHLPAVAEHGVWGEWTGIMAGTPDGLPLLGEIPGLHGQFLSLGFNGYGMSFAFLAGRCLAEMIRQGRAEHRACRLFHPSRFLEGIPNPQLP